MKLIVLGATGGTGRAFVEQALAVGHVVTAVARNPAAISTTHAHLTVVQGDAQRYASIVSLLPGHDAVVSTLGTGTSRKPTTIYSVGTANIIRAMDRAGIARLVAVSSSAVVNHPSVGFVYGKIIKPLWFMNVYRDMATMEAIITQSGVHYTIARPARLVDTPHTGKYRESEPYNPSGGSKIARADLADFLLKALDSGVYNEKTIALAY